MDVLHVYSLLSQKSRALNKGDNSQHLLRPSMLDGPLLLQVNLVVAFVSDVKLKATQVNQP